jgi:hypothetical protein
MPRGRASARLGAVTALLATVGALTACEDETGPDPAPDPEPVAEPTVAVDQAQQTYHPLVAEVVEAVAGVSVPGRPDDRHPEVIYYASDLDSCVYASLRYEFDTVFGESDSASWDDVRAATEQVLEPEGFEVTEQLEIPGGYNGFDAATDDGTRLEVRSKLGDASTISLDAPVRGDCDQEISETLPPLPG